MKASTICLAAALALPLAAGAEQSKFTEGTLIVLNKSEATATLISLVTGETVATLGTGIGPHEVAVSPDGKLAVVCNYSERPSTLTVIDLERRRPVRTIHLGQYTAPHGIVFMPDGERIIATVERSRAVVVVNLKEREIESAILERALKRLKAIAGGVAVIVVDGGSKDGTQAIAQRHFQTETLQCASRGTQMNHGAARIDREVLLFYRRLPGHPLFRGRRIPAPPSSGGPIRHTARGGSHLLAAFPASRHPATATKKHMDSRTLRTRGASQDPKAVLFGRKVI